MGKKTKAGSWLTHQLLDVEFVKTCSSLARVVTLMATVYAVYPVVSWLVSLA